MEYRIASVIELVTAGTPQCTTLSSGIIKIEGENSSVTKSVEFSISDGWTVYYSENGTMPTVSENGQVTGGKLYTMFYDAIVQQQEKVDISALSIPTTKKDWVFSITERIRYDNPQLLQYGGKWNSLCSGDKILKVVPEYNQDAEGAGVDSVTFNAEESGKMCYKLNKNSTYYIQVCMYDTETSGKFSLKVTAIPDDFEDTLETATAMTLGKEFFGKFEVAEDRDYASIDTSDSMLVCEVTFTNMDLASGAEITLLDSDEATVENMYAEKGEMVSFTVKLEKNSRYYLYMAAEDSEETGKYKVRVNVKEDNAGDTIESASPVLVNQVMSGAFEIEGDGDYLKFTTFNCDCFYQVSLTNHSVAEEITLLWTSEEGAIEGSLGVTKGTSDSMILQLEKNRDYYISLSAENATGTYSFQVIMLPGDADTSIEPTPQVVSGDSIVSTPLVTSGNGIAPTPLVASDNGNGVNGYVDKTTKYTAPKTVKLNKTKLTLKPKKKATLRVSVAPANAVRARPGLHPKQKLPQ